jgi:hypothetical protein
MALLSISGLTGCGAVQRLVKRLREWLTARNPLVGPNPAR